MDRRSFLKGLLGTTALAALPISLIPPAFASGGVIPITVKFYGVDINYPGAEFKLYSTFKKGLKATGPYTYTFKLNTREFTK